MIRVYLIIGALFLAALAWKTHEAAVAKKALAAAEVRADRADADLAAERDNTRKANEAATRLQARADALEADRRDNPLPAVRLCPRRTVLPETRATAVPGEAAQADHAGADAGDSDQDIGPALDDFATDAQENLNQCEELIRWVKER